MKTVFNCFSFILFLSKLNDDDDDDDENKLVRAGI